MKHEMKTKLAMVFLAFFFNAFNALASEIILQQGEAISIKVLGCKSYEEQTFTADKSLMTVTTDCELSKCQAELRKNGNVEVYRYKNEDCNQNGCNLNAVKVGSYHTALNYIQWMPLRIVKPEMQDFLAYSNDCGSLRFFLNGAFVMERKL